MFQYVPEFFAPVFVHVERFVSIAHDCDLLLLDREPRIDKENRVLSRRTLSANEKRCICPLHGAGYGNAAFRRNIDIDKCLDKTRCFRFYIGCAIDIRIDRGDAILKSFDLGIDTDLGCFQSGNTHFHMDKFCFSLLFKLCGYGNDLADRRFPEIGKSVAIYNLSGCLIIYRSILHDCYYLYERQK